MRCVADAAAVAEVEGRTYPVSLTFLDFDGNGNVGASDLLALLANWGPCP